MKVGDIIGDYEALAPLGQGGMATVWRVRHTVLHSEHALKLLDPELAARPSLRDRFLAEGRILAQLRHPHLVPVSGAVLSDDHAALVMDLIRGPSLAHVLEAEGPIRPLPRLVRLCRGVLDGLQHAHSQGVIHRDLKPENLLLATASDGTEHPVLVDFGVAKLLNGGRVEHKALRATRAKAVFGTPHYMSPEQIEASAEVDHRTDVFAMGAVLYEMITGQRAFVGDTATEVLYRVQQGDYHLPPSVPAPLAEVVRRALSPDREDRFPTAQAMSDALQAAEQALPNGLDALAPVGTDPTDASGPVAPQPSGPTDGERMVQRLLVVFGILLSLGVVGLGVGLLVAYQEEVAAVQQVTQAAAEAVANQPQPADPPAPERPPAPPLPPTQPSPDADADLAADAVPPTDGPQVPAPTTPDEAPFAEDGPSSDPAPPAEVTAPAEDAPPAEPPPAAEPTPSTVAAPATPAAPDPRDLLRGPVRAAVQPCLSEATPRADLVLRLQPGAPVQLLKLQRVPTGATSRCVEKALANVRAPAALSGPSEIRLSVRR